jgi:two-component system sensor histidine kinase PilS (NtrC family)
MPMNVVDQQQWLSWLIRVRMVIITFLLGIQLVVIPQVARTEHLSVPHVPLKYFLAVLIFWYLIDLIHHILLKISNDYTAQSYLQIGLDIVMVSLVVYFTGGLDSYFYFLYPLTVLVGSIVLSQGGAYLVANLSFIAAGIMLELPYYEIIPSYSLGFPDLKELRLKIAGNLVAFVAVAYLGSKLATILRQTGVELADLQALNQDIIESMRSGLVTTDLKGQILLSNSAACEILDLPLKSLQDRTLASLFPEMVVGGQSDAVGPRRETVWQGGNSGREKFLGFSVAPLTREGQTVGYVYNFQDLTQLKKLERELQIKDRMAAIGRMAAGIAHEIRNPLASIAGSVKLFSGMVDLQAEEHRLIQIVLKESERLNTIITDFLFYSREMGFQFHPVDLTEILEETLTLLRNHPKFDSRYRIESDLPSDPATVSVDSDRMRQVFWNLGDNAFKAMPEGGVLSVSVAQREERVEIAFRDTGTGMTARQLEKVFEPFQSEFQGGTGLGLAIVYQIIQAHKGNIRAESHGHGCVFRIELPCAPAIASTEVHHDMGVQKVRS